MSRINLKRGALALLCCLPWAAHPKDCDTDAAAALVASIVKAIGSEDCRARLKDLGAGGYWLAQCEQLEGRHKPLPLEFARRTRSTFSGLAEKDGQTYAVVDFEGPDTTAFMFTLPSVASCTAPAQPPAELPKDFAAFMPEQKKCDDSVWRDIPVAQYKGAFPLACRQGRWFLVDPPASAR